MVEVPAAVRQKAVALGAVGERWLTDLDRMVDGLEADWGFEAGQPLSGGSAAYVAAAVTNTGEAAVLKVAMPAGLEGNGPFENEVLALSLGAADCYVRVLHADVDRRALLLERLGRALSRCGLAVESQIEILASTMQRGWRRPSDTARLPTGADQARWLGGFIQRNWDDLQGPCPRHIVARALRYTERRYGAFDASTAVLVHGDAHPSNVLEDLAYPPPSRRFKLIDPEGLMSEPAHDLAIPLRVWTDELLAGDTFGQGRAWCAQLGGHAGVDDAAIWEWAFIELVSTGLFLLRLGDGLGHRLLEVADRWTDAS